MTILFFPVLFVLRFGLRYLHEKRLAFQFALTPQSGLGQIARLTILKCSIVSTISLKHKSDKQTGEAVETRFKNILKTGFMYEVQ